jgi:16S rRNA (guanine527-N7)-methyltransferase
LSPPGDGPGPAFDEALDRGAAALGIAVDEAARERLRRFAVRLLAWNRKVNLTAITDPAEVAEKHVVDALALLRSLGDARTLLDLGSGAGIPGAVLACARPDLAVTCCDAVAKKVAFVKAVSAELDLPVRALAARAEGHPERERLPRADAVVSRALGEPTRWVPLGARYVAPGGALFAMLGRDVDGAALGALGALEGLLLESVDRFTLPLCGAERAIARWRRP